MCCWLWSCCSIDRVDCCRWVKAVGVCIRYLCSTHAIQARGSFHVFKVRSVILTVKSQAGFQWISPPDLQLKPFFQSLWFLIPLLLVLLSFYIDCIEKRTASRPKKSSHWGSLLNMDPFQWPPGGTSSFFFFISVSHRISLPLWL